MEMLECFSVEPWLLACGEDTHACARVCVCVSEVIAKSKRACASVDRTLNLKNRRERMADLVGGCVCIQRSWLRVRTTADATDGVARWRFSWLMGVRLPRNASALAPLSRHPFACRQQRRCVRDCPFERHPVCACVRTCASAYCLYRDAAVLDRIRVRACGVIDRDVAFSGCDPGFSSSSLTTSTTALLGILM